MGWIFNGYSKKSDGKNLINTKATYVDMTDGRTFTEAFDEAITSIRNIYSMIKTDPNIGAISLDKSEKF